MNDSKNGHNGGQPAIGEKEEGGKGDHLAMQEAFSTPGMQPGCSLSPLNMSYLRCEF